MSSTISTLRLYLATPADPADVSISAVGCSLEGMDKLFAVPLHKIHSIAYPTDEGLKPEMKASGASGDLSMDSAEDKGIARHREVATLA